MSDSGRVVSKGPCPACGSRDNLATYEDGHSHCFGMSCGYHTTSSDGAQPQRRQRMASGLIEGEVRPLPPRALTKEACQKFGVRVGKLGEETVVTMDYRDQDGNIVAQKVRLPASEGEKKRFTILGDAKRMGLFGQHLWSPGGRKIVVTEGELDAVAGCQADGLKWPWVSIPNGASNAKKAIAQAREFLESFDQVVLAFDADEVGRQAVAEAASVLTPGKVRVADFGPYGFKDANEAVVAGDERKLLDAIWKARAWRPDGIVSLADIRDRVLNPIEIGRPWPWPGLTAATFGRRMGDVIGIGAGTGVGKTDFLTQCIAEDIRAGVKVGVLSFEQDVGETGKRVAGKMVGRRFHVPDGSWTSGDLEAAWDALEATGNLFLYDSHGATDWPTVKARMNYMVDVLGAEHLYLDNLTAIAAGEEDERVTLEKVMAEAAGMAKGRCVLHFVSHLATPEGKPHEEGGRVMIRHFKGSRAIGFWSHFMLGLERDQSADDLSARHSLTVRCLKDRMTGQATGRTFPMLYDAQTGLLSEGSVEGRGDMLDLVTAEGAGF